jgi:hypothetical protein
VQSTHAAPPSIRTYRLYFGSRALEKIGTMEALYIAGIAAFWTILLLVVKRRSAGEA